jgi:ribulose-phosphate 3-epimerase
VPSLELELGVKSDPIEYRYSFDWLFALMKSEGVRHLQLGTFHELYGLPDDHWRRLRDLAARHDVSITSVFTSHRELGGFFVAEPGWADVARRGYERLIEVAALVGARSAGSNPGSVMRDRPGDKAAGLAAFALQFKELLYLAHDRGLEALCIEPMSCLAEPPTLPEEIAAMLGDLDACHRAHAASTAAPRLCSDVAHGYADAVGRVRWDNMQLLGAGLPWLYEVHLKNTDALFNATFGFAEADRARGIVDVAAVRALLEREAGRLPVSTLVGYLEIGGPKWGRDYSDGRLEGDLRAGLAWLRGAWCGPVAAAGATSAPAASAPPAARAAARAGGVQVSPSLMCADLCSLGSEVERLERLGVAMLHLDIMDGRFAPNMPLGLETVRQLRPRTRLPFDVHLMVEDNDWFVGELARIGVERIAVHAESARHLDRTLALIRDGGAAAGVALNPATPPEALAWVLDRVDFVIVMTVNPGFAGQKMVPGAIAKIEACARFLRERGCGAAVEVDGNVSFENIPAMVAAGARILVAGTSSLFAAHASQERNMEELLAAAARGLGSRP